MQNKIIRIPRRFSKTQRISEAMLERFIDKEEYPELFGKEPEFEFEVEHEEEKGLMPLEELKENIKAHNATIEDDGELNDEVSDFEITED